MVVTTQFHRSSLLALHLISLKNSHLCLFLLIYHPSISFSYHSRYFNQHLLYHWYSWPVPFIFRLLQRGSWASLSCSYLPFLQLPYPVKIVWVWNFVLDQHQHLQVLYLRPHWKALYQCPFVKLLSIFIWELLFALQVVIRLTYKPVSDFQFNLINPLKFYPSLVQQA